jgi:hypothetical protein
MTFAFGRMEVLLAFMPKHAEPVLQAPVWDFRPPIGLRNATERNCLFRAQSDTEAASPFH